MDCKTSDRISFQQRLFAREQLAERWPALNKYICSANSVEGAYTAMLRNADGKLEIERGAAQEALEFYNTVVRDGRYIEDILTSPREVAAKLRIELSDEVMKHLNVVSGLLAPGSTKMNIAVVAVAVAVTVVIVKGADPLEEIVINQSGLIRL